MRRNEPLASAASAHRSVLAALTQALARKRRLIVMPASLVTAAVGGIGMLAGAVVDGRQAHAIAPVHAAHGATHSGVYSWTFMILACWVCGWVIMSRKPERAACLLTSTALMISVPAALTYTGMSVGSAFGAHAIMLGTMVLAHECGARVGARLQTVSRASTATLKRISSPPPT